MAVATCAVLVLFILVFGRFIAQWFTQTQEVVDVSQQMLRILASGFVCLGLAMVLWGTVRGAGDATSPMWASFVNTVVIRVPSAYLFVFLIGRPEALMYSMVLAWTVNMILSIIIYRVGKWRTKGLISKSDETSEPAETEEADETIDADNLIE